jgi:hypothetical protein
LLRINSLIENLRVYFQVKGIDTKFCINEFVSYFRNKENSNQLTNSRYSSDRKEKKKEALNMNDLNNKQGLSTNSEELEESNILDLKNEILDMIYYINDQLFPIKANL